MCVVTDVGFWHLDLFSSEEVATQAQRFVKPLCVHLDKVAALFKVRQPHPLEVMLIGCHCAGW